MIFIIGDKGIQYDKKKDERIFDGFIKIMVDLFKNSKDTKKGNTKDAKKGNNSNPTEILKLFNKKIETELGQQPIAGGNMNTNIFLKRILIDILNNHNTNININFLSNILNMQNIVSDEIISSRQYILSKKINRITKNIDDAYYNGEQKINIYSKKVNNMYVPYIEKNNGFTYLNLNLDNIFNEGCDTNSYIKTTFEPIEMTITVLIKINFQKEEYRKKLIFKLSE